MKRRELMMVGASTALAHGVTTVMGCGAQGQAAKATTPAALVGKHADQRAEVMVATSECLRDGEVCLAQCLRLLGKGDTSMADCSKGVQQMLAVCGAVPALAAADAPRLRALLEVCAAVCEDCEAACRPHVGHHPECAACAASCLRCAAACRAMLS
ncbi:MAG: Csp1 family four helix bundle copper storage protein [Polyangiales bacterium]